MPKRYLHGPMTWKVMQRNAWKGIANWRTKQLNSQTKSQHHAWMIINLKKKMDQLVNYLLFAHKWFWNAYILHVLVDLIFYGLWTNLLGRWRHGQKHVANAQHVWSHTYIHHTSEYLQFCFVGNTAQQCRLGVSSCFWFCRRPWRLNINIGRNSVYFSEVTRSCQEVGCARNRLQFHTVLQKLKWCLSMQVYAWTEFQLLIFGICWLK